MQARGRPPRTPEADDGGRSCGAVRAARGATERHRELRLDARFFPPLRVRHPASLDFEHLLHDFMMKPEQAERPSGSSAPIDIAVRHLDLPARGDVDRYRMPTFDRLYRGPRPGQSYDLAAIRFQPSRGSTLWLSDRVPNGSNYMANAVRPLVTHACATLGNALLHSALVAYEGRGILLPGEAFSGKSSLSFFGLLCGARLVSDDLVLLARTEAGPIGRGFRSSFLLRPRTQALIGEPLRSLGSPVQVGDTLKHVYTREALGTRTATEAPLSALVFPHIDAASAPDAAPGFRLESLDKSTALATMMRCIDATVLMPGLDAERAAVTRTMLSLTRERPCLRLTMGPAFLDDPGGSARAAFDAVLEGSST